MRGAGCQTAGGYSVLIPSVLILPVLTFSGRRACFRLTSPSFIRKKKLLITKKGRVKNEISFSGTPFSMLFSPVIFFQIYFPVHAFRYPHSCPGFLTRTRFLFSKQVSQSDALQNQRNDPPGPPWPPASDPMRSQNPPPQRSAWSRRTSG